MEQLVGAPLPALMIMCQQVSGCNTDELTMQAADHRRFTTRLQSHSQRPCPVRGQLLDSYSRNSNRAGWDEDLPDVQKLARGLAELHMNGVNPDGKYGFYVPTLQGTVPQYTEWTETWEEFFSNSIRRVFENEEKSQGYDEEVHELCRLTLEKVVPRLLRPLETGGRENSTETGPR